MKNRNFLIDVIKGVLVVLVLIGHFVLGSLEESYIRSFIYFFHMPVFLGITGYFISSSTVNDSIIGILKKYKNRLIIPTLLAFVFCSFFYSGFSFRTLIYPYYHLWYIPAIFIYIFFLKYLAQVYKFRILLGISVICFILCTIYFETYFHWEYNKGILWYLGDKRFYYFFSYFGLGFFLKIKKVDIPYSIIISSILVGIGVYLFFDFGFSRGISRTIINYSLIYLAIDFSTKNTSLLKSNTIAIYLQKISIVSLPIYLWHIVISNFGKRFFIEHTYIHLQPLVREILYYGFEIIAMSIFVYVIIKFEGKNKYIDKYFYGR